MGQGSSSTTSLSPAVQARIADFCLLADLAGVELMVMDAASGCYLACNDAASTRRGYGRSEMAGLSAAAIQVDPDHDQSLVAARIHELVTAGGGSFETRHRCKDGSILHVSISSRVVELEGRTVLINLVVDRTRVHLRERQLQQQLDLLCAGEMFNGVGSWDLRFADGRMRWSPQMERLCRFSHHGEDTTLWNYGTLVHPDDRTGWHHDLQRAITRGEPFFSQHRLTFDDGTELMVEANATISYDHEGHPLRAVGSLRDVSQQQERLRQQIDSRCCDPLTGLPNKIGMVQELTRWLKGRSYNNSLAILSLDVDGFQEINDNFGPEIGDLLLRAIGERLRNLIGPDALIARLSSDQFLVVLDQGIHSIGDAIGASRQLQQRWSQTNHLLPELQIFPTFSLGIATYPEHGQEAEALIQCANTALMKAKSQGRVQVCVYSSTLSRQIQERMHLGSELAQAITREQFRLMVQPQLHQGSTLVGGEMLLRWTNHRGVAVPPSYFIPLAEESGLIVPLGDWVLDETLKHLDRWRQAGLHTPRLGLNVSPRQLETPGRQFISSLLDGLNTYNIRPDQLELEITETALLRDPILAREQLRVLADQGFRIAIDDFGTGYSSLELLRSLPVHRLKIDRTFVQGVATSPEDRTIVTTIITLAHGLGMDCIAEGVETEEQRLILSELGCDYYQGYLYGRPLEIDDFACLLREQTHADVGALTDVAAPTPLRPPISVPLRPEVLCEGGAVPSTFTQLELLRAAFDLTDVYFLVLQVMRQHDGTIEDFLILEANQAGCAYMQQEREAVVGQTILAIFPQMESNGLLDLYVDAANKNSPRRINDFVYQDHDLLKDNRCYDIQVLPTNGFLVVTWRDVTERSKTARSLAEAAALYRLLTENIVDVVALLNEQEQVVWVSPSLQPMTGWREDQWQGKSFSDLFAVAEGQPDPITLARWLNQAGTVRQGRLRLADPRGGWSWVQLGVRRASREGMRSLDGFDDNPMLQAGLNLNEGYVMTLQPVDRQVMDERSLLRRANSDPLTGLESRAAILARLELRLMDDQALTAQPVALLFCDLDHFKSINDTYGHACGDAVLNTASERIRSLVHQRDHAGRIGGDEFLVLLEGVHKLEDAIAVAEKLQQLISQPIPWADRSITPTFSIGVALHGAGEDADLFLRRADRNMVAAKDAGRHCVRAL
jgi:diguanylate cyclase (GGDEF)-like protein/PAS domain S-box-containing protein